jgi:hypothetical protein
MTPERLRLRSAIEVVKLGGVALIQPASCNRVGRSVTLGPSGASLRNSYPIVIRKCRSTLSGIFSILFAGLFHDFHDATGTGVNQYRSVVDHGVAVLPNTIFLRNVVVSHTRFRKLSAHP